MTTVIILTANGFLKAPFPSDERAKNFIGAWVNMDNAEREASSSSILMSQPSGKPQSWAVLCKDVIGMYIAQDAPSIPERAVAAMEKLVDDGNEWKGK